MKVWSLHILLLGCLGLCSMMLSCRQKVEGKAEDLEKHEQAMSETYVDTMTLHVTPFDKQIVCNGRLRAKAKSDLTFLSQGVTTEIFVHEGQRVTKGTLIASLDKRERTREVEKAEHEVYRAKVELTDKLIGLGYDADMKDVPADVMQRAEVTSGYYSAKYQLQSARTALEECNLYAPFNGRIANLDARSFQRAEKVCTLIDDSQFDVEFKILEAELEHIAKGQEVKVSSFVEDSVTYEGIITEINPLVDDKGLIKIMARMANRGDALMDGMNVRVVVEQRVQNMFVVPKDAVVERDGYHVIFRYEDGHAVWTYVDIVYSNINSFAITGCQRKETTIHEGDIVITSGNLNLADGTEVRIGN
ncbi:MAG: efflux RND transporter periplasmic adaptor subunit [Bacteroidaceae bacterium]|nr:efflux RND transporter periplasmic adaptor subunit [Bacteroidaceae bacterium]